MFCNVYGQTDQYCKSQSKLIELLHERHLKPVDSDSTLALRTTEILLQRLDPYSIYFTTKDESHIKSHLLKSFQPDQCIGLDSIYEFLQLSLESRIIEARILKKKRPDFTIKDTLFQIAGKRVDELDASWNKVLKAKVLGRHFSKSKNLLDEEAYTLIPDSTINNIWQQEICLLEQTREKLETIDYLKKIIFQSIANAYDPHTNYLRFEDYENFVAEISKTKKSFGLLVYQGFESIEVAEVDKNSPAWRAGIRAEEQVIDILENGRSLLNRCLDLFDLNKELTNPEVSDITVVTLRNEQLVKTQLIKQEYNIRDDAYISLLLNGDKKIGYFRLHNFYTDIENLSADGCANDVASELIKMKRDQIEGLILDLRDNGGGSLKEAIGLAGIFINYGKLAYVRNREDESISMKDFNKGQIFNKPLVILINESSASAAEIVATILKENGVALLAGDQTFGKYIGQSAREADIEDQTSYLITTDIQFYNLKGESFQQVGQSPDIKLPNLKSTRSEASYLFPLRPDKIEVKPIEIINTIPYTHLRTKSKSRTDQTRLLMDSVSSISNYIPLNAYEYIEWSNQILHRVNQLKVPLEPIFEVTSTSYDADLISIIKEEKENFNLDKSDVESDNQIIEAYQIISDWITIQQNE